MKVLSAVLLLLCMFTTAGQAVASTLGVVVASGNGNTSSYSFFSGYTFVNIGSCIGCSVQIDQILDSQDNVIAAISRIDEEKNDNSCYVTTNSLFDYDVVGDCSYFEIQKK